MRITDRDLESFVPTVRHTRAKTFLHVGCGTATRSRLPEIFQGRAWREIRVDIDPNVRPDILASFTDLSSIPDKSVEGVWSSHSLEHLEGFDVEKALLETRRVLKTGGFLLLTLPDLELIAKLIVEGRSDEVAYVSPAGPITAMDMLFGHQASTASGQKYMAHRTGFTADRLYKKLVDANFEDVRIMHGKAFDLWAVAVAP